MSTHKRGFTLIELLVVIAIVATLMALIFPAVGKMREAGGWAATVNNARSLAQAQLQYAADNNGSLPPRAMSGSIMARMEPFRYLVNRYLPNPYKVLGSPLAPTAANIPQADYPVCHYGPGWDGWIDWKYANTQVQPIAFESWSWPEVWCTAGPNQKVVSQPSDYLGNTLDNPPSTTKLVWSYEWDLPKRYGKGVVAYLDGHAVVTPTKSYDEWWQWMATKQ